MRDAAHHELLESGTGLQLVISMLTAVLNILNHMQEADIPPTRGGSHHNNNNVNGKAPRRPSSENGSARTVGLGALLSVRIDAQREYKVDEVAQHLRISPQTVRKMIDNDKLKGEKRGTGRGHWIVPGTELLRFTHQTDDHPS